MNNNNGKNTLTAATKLRKALSCDSVLAANGVCSYLDKYPEDMCEERTSWDVLKKYVTKLQYGFEALGAAINDALNTEVLPGDTVAMREALEAWIEYRNWGGYDALHERGLRAQTKAALAAPPRNCDIGTAMEQASRHKIFCKNHAYHCNTCPFEEHKQDCEFIWGQLPYVAEQKEED